jgi:hypothetical protein
VRKKIIRSYQVKKWIPEALAVAAIIMVAGYGLAQTWTQPIQTSHDIDAIALSADGKIAVAVGSELGAMVSINSGATWTTNAVYHAFNRVACSADGTKLLAAFFSSPGNIYLSTNSGYNWTASTSPSANWSAVASSADGVKLAGAIYNGRIWLSTNSGASWATSGAPVKNWASLASSTDGTKLAAAPSGDIIYSSTNSGITWTATGSASDSWFSIACSADGRQLLAAANSGVYISTNSGGSWTLANSDAGPVASSADGTKLIICGGSTWTSSDSGNTWVSNNVPYNNFPPSSSVASSADGNRLLAAPYRSGIWTVNLAAPPAWAQNSAPSNNWLSIALSADGHKLAAGVYGGGILTSTNSGATWTQTTARNGNWISIAPSADGMKLLTASFYSASYPGGIYTSTNGGDSWVSNNLPSESWNTVASSADGCKLVAVAAFTTNQSYIGAIYTSTNSGSDWTSNSMHGIRVISSADGNKLFLFSAPYNWRSTNAGASWTKLDSAPLDGGSATTSQDMACSADGNKLVLGLITDTNNNPGQIYTSTNAGDSWQLTSAPSNNWGYVASSADGSTLLAVSLWTYEFSPIYISTNAGATWTSNNSPTLAWGGVASSADGGVLVAAATYDTNYNTTSIYTLQSIRSPSLNSSAPNGNLTVSWLVPSTNFVLQSSADLAGWTNLTNQPVLNLTNLQNQVALPPPGSNFFYRLKMP